MTFQTCRRQKGSEPGGRRCPEKFQTFCPEVMVEPSLALSQGPLTPSLSQAPGPPIQHLALGEPLPLPFILSLFCPNTSLEGTFLPQANHVLGQCPPGTPVALEIKTPPVSNSTLLE